METVKIIEVGPELAKEWLKYNNSNRKPSDIVISRYANDMKNGLWKFTGASIVFNGDGTLLDGQQRLAAVIKSNTVQKFVVTSGVDKSAFMQMDIGKKRSPADTLTIKPTLAFNLFFKAWNYFRMNENPRAINLTIKTKTVTPI